MINNKLKFGNLFSFHEIIPIFLCFIRLKSFFLWGVILCGNRKIVKVNSIIFKISKKHYELNKKLLSLLISFKNYSNIDNNIF